MLPKNKKQILIASFCSAIIFFGLVFAHTVLAAATSASTISECPRTNPAGTIVCPNSTHFVNGNCRPDSSVTAMITACLNLGRNEVFNCTNGQCVCQSDFRDCRNTVGVNKCLASTDASAVDSAGHSACDPLNRSFNSCTGQCASCANDTQEVDGQCMSLAQVNARVGAVDTRVIALEGVEICHFATDENGHMAYLNDHGQSCPETFDPASLDGRFAALQTAVSGVSEIISTLVSSSQLTDSLGELMNDLMTGDIAGLQQAIHDFQQELNEIAPVTTVQHADTADTLNMTCATNQIMQFSSGSWQCGTLPGTSQFVGLSVPAADGNRGGYQPANNTYCANVNINGVSGSHICTATEIIDSYVIGSAALGDAAGRARINNGPPAYLENISNDCNGWNSSSPTIFSSIWNFTSDLAAITPCDNSGGSLPFACCK